MKPAYFIGIDNGGTMSKAAVFDRYGTEISVASCPVEILTPHTGWSERDLTTCWTDTARMIQQAIRDAAIPPGEIKGVACTGHGNGLHLLDKSGQAVRNGINSSDTRAQSYIEQWCKNRIDDKLLPVIAQSLWAAQPAPLLAWMRDNEPELFGKIDTIYMIKDFIRFCLTGKAHAEITDISGTGLIHVPEGRYDQQILDTYGLTEISAFLPPLIESAQIAGYITREASFTTGIPEGVPVAGGLFDIDACALSSGILNSSQFSLVAGTWGNNQYIAREPLIDKELFMTSRYAIPGWYLMLEGSPTSAGNLEWILETFFQEERKQAGNHFYQYISEWVTRVKPTDPGPVFLPFLYGSNNGNLKGGFIGLDALHTRGHLLRAVFEGVVFSHYQHIERLLNFRELPEVIRLTGGAARNPVWCQLFADCIGVPVEVPAGTELGALGAAIVATVATGYYTDLPEAVQNMTSIDKRYEPNPEYTAVYRAKYAQYREIIMKLQ